jgi:hypothetical protein
MALTELVTGSWYHSFWITSFGWTFLGGAGVYLWVKEWTASWQATIAAVVYILVPYHTFQIYQAVLYAEFAAAGILPFCFLFLLRTYRRSRWIDALLFSVSYSALILTHIPSTIIASLSIGVYGLLIMEWRSFLRTAAKMGTALALSLLATSFYFARALPEINWVMHSSPQYFSSGYYDYKRYLFPIFWSSTPTRYVEKMLWHIDLMVVLTILLFLPSAVVYLLKKIKKKPDGAEWKMDRSVILAGLFTIFMLSAASSAIWHFLPIMQKIQFPWRWLLVMSLMGSVAISVAIPKLLFSFGNSKRLFGYPILLGALFVIIISITQNILPSTPLAQDIFEQKVEKMSDEEACDCWWPIWAKRGAFINPDRVDAGARTAVVEKWANASRDLSVEPGNAGSVRVATFYHPFWTSTVNNVGTPVQYDENGVIVIPLPAEAAKVHLQFKEPLYLEVARIVSMLTWLALAVVIGVYLVHFRKGKVSEHRS